MSIQHVHRIKASAVTLDTTDKIYILFKVSFNRFLNIEYTWNIRVHYYICFMACPHFLHAFMQVNLHKTVN